VSTAQKYHSRIFAKQRPQRDSSEFRVTEVAKAAQSGEGLDDVKVAHVGI